MGRYHAARRAVWDKVLAETSRAKDMQRVGHWATYLIRDPRYPDKRGNQGIPIYVGQTDDLPRRVLSRFTKCEKTALEHGGDCVEKRVAELLREGVVATYEVLDYQPTRLTSLVSETNWARRCWKAGYNLANRAKLQNQGGDPVGPEDIPTGWIDKFTVPQAIADGIVVNVTCGACEERLAIPLHTLDLARAATTVGQLANELRELPCTFCGVTGRRRISRRAPRNKTG